MKRNYTLVLLTLICLFSFSDIKAQPYMLGHLTINVLPAMSHDSTICSSSCGIMYSITVDSSFVDDSVKIVDMGSMSIIGAYGNTTGANPWVFMASIPMYTPLITDDQVSGGLVHFIGPTVKVISRNDTISALSNLYNYVVTNPCLYGNVSGTVYIDNNSDCIYNTGDVALNSIPVSSTASLTGTGPSSIGAVAYSGVTGTYNMTVRQSWMTSYTVSIPSYYYFIFPITPCFSGAYTYTTLPQTNVDFPLQCTGNVDVLCWAGSPATSRVNTPFYMQPFVSNIGCDSASGVLTLVKDSRVTYDPASSTYPAMAVSGDTLTWNYTNLTNLTSGAYWNSFFSSIYLTPDTSVHVGDTLCFRVYTNILPTDINTSNNDYTICLPVVYSYDPNLKEVSPKGTGIEGYIPASTGTLSYTLHFQNTGTSYAADISIIDTLDANVDPATLKIQGTSNTMSPEWLAPGVVRFNFAGINLPDSTTNEAASHGFVRFNVDLHPGLAAGTQVKNTGYIYFDSNPAVVTNTALNTIANTTFAGNVPATTNTVRVYPNPANDLVSVDNLQNGRILVINMDGSVIIDQHVTNRKTTLDISHLPDGVYIIKTINAGNTTTGKFIKQ